jgi:hypothetical protein
VEGIFKDFVMENKLTSEEYGRQIIAKVWGASAQLPPDIP